MQSNWNAYLAVTFEGGPVPKISMTVAANNKREKGKGANKKTEKPEITKQEKEKAQDINECGCAGKRKYLCYQNLHQRIKFPLYLSFPQQQSSISKVSRFLNFLAISAS